MATEAQRRALKKYYQKSKPYRRVFVLRLDKRKCPEVVDMIEAQPNKTAYIVSLVEKDIGGE